MRATAALAAIVALFVAVAPACAQPSPFDLRDAIAPALRLPAGIRPLAYDVKLAVVPGAPDANGEIAIDVELDRAEPLLWLHAHSVRVHKAAVAGSDAKVTVVPRGNVVALGFDPPLAAGRHRVTLEFTSLQSRGDARGIFTMQQGGAWYTMTQFEPISARRAFPCFDEPGFKVPWTLALVVPRDLVAFANAPEIATEDAPNGMKIVRFAPTRPLPSYLVAFAVGPWSSVDAGKVGMRATPTRIIVPNGRERDASFVRSAYPDLFVRIERWFGIAYGYPKLDHIAIPLGTGFAMENPGLITYGEGNFLARPDDESARFRRRAVGVGAHEISHQWFGNLVTMAWWDDIWLNESFATWFTHKTVAEWRPDWKRAARPVVGRAEAMQGDARPSARRIRQPIASEGDIRNAFDSITYQKGATVIAMFERWIGEDVFRTAVRRYVDVHRDGNATADDFLRTLEATSGRPVRAAFSTFLDQPGFPVVAVSLACTAQGAELALSQRRYAPIGASSNEATRWQIPVCVTYGDRGGTAQACTLLDGPDARLALGGSCPAMVMANAGGENYYLPDYRGDLPTRLRERRAALSTGELVSVVLDLRPQVAAGIVRAADAMPWIEAAAESRERSVVDAAVEIAAYLRDDVAGPEEETAFDAFVLRTFGPRMRELGIVPRSGDGEDDELLRATLLPFAGTLDPGIAREAGRLALEWIANPRAIDPGMVEPVLLTAARTGDAALFDALLAKALEASTVGPRREMLVALFSFDDPALARRGQALLLDTRFDVRDLLAAQRDSLRKGRPRPYAHEFVAQNFDALAKRVTADQPAYWPWVARGLCGDAARAEVEALWRDRAPGLPGARRNADQVLEEIDACTAVRKAQQPSLHAYLARRPL
jgi:alanyl aminopeptidase